MLFSKSFLCSLLSLSLTLTLSSLFPSFPSLSSIQVPRIPVDSEGNPATLSVCNVLQDGSNIISGYSCSPQPQDRSKWHSPPYQYACWDNGDYTDCACYCYSINDYPDFKDAQQAQGVASEDIRSEWFGMMDKFHIKAEGLGVLGFGAGSAKEMDRESPVLMASPMALPLKENYYGHHGGHKESDVMEYSPYGIGYGHQGKGHRRERRAIGMFSGSGSDSETMKPNLKTNPLASENNHYPHHSHHDKVILSGNDDVHGHVNGHSHGHGDDMEVDVDISLRIM